MAMVMTPMIPAAVVAATFRGLSSKPITSRRDNRLRSIRKRPHAAIRPHCLQQTSRYDVTAALM
jgi:hypothetical protein